MINRPILVVMLGYLIGIIIGLYCKISIAFFIIPITILILLLKYKINNTIKHYYNIFCIRRILIILFISALISNTIVLFKNKLYETKYMGIEKANFIATVESLPKEKQYSIQYKIRIESVNDNKEYKDTYLYLNTKKDDILKYGDKVKFTGNFIEPEIQRNYRGFNYKQYLKSVEVYGTVKTNNVKVIGIGIVNPIKKVANNVAESIKEILNKNINNEDNKNLLLGIMLGDDSNLEDNIKENFQNSSLSHILAVSGMHVSYVILGVSLLLSSIKLPKKLTKILTIIFLVFFIFLTGESPSVKRACIMAIMFIFATLIYKKSDTITNISMSLLIILIQNPFSIIDIGLILSFSATLGIIMFYKLILRMLNSKKEKGKIIKRLLDKLKEIISVSLAAQVLILPLSMLFFNKISLTFLLSNIAVSLVIIAIIILGFIAVIIPFEFLFTILNSLLEVLKFIADFFSNIPFSKIIVVTPNLWFIVGYYILVLTITYLFLLRKKEIKRRIEKRILTYVDKFKSSILIRKKTILVAVTAVIMLLQIMNFIPKDLKIHFIDVGQGDSALIITPYNKTILIDGGGSDLSDFDIRKKYSTSILIR